VTLTDFVFTAGGAALIVATGVGNTALHQIDISQTRWLAWGMGVFIASGIIWVAILIPVQILASTYGELQQPMIIGDSGHSYIEIAQISCPMLTRSLRKRCKAHFSGIVTT